MRPTRPRTASGSSPGCTRSRRPRCGSPVSSALQKPFLHLHTQYNREDPVGRDRHGLHEPQPGRPRRPRVRVHRGADAPRAQGRGRPLGATRRSRTGSARGPARRRARHDWRDGPDRPLRREHARGRGHRRRQGRGPAAARLQHQRLRRRRPGRASSTRRPTPRSTSSIATYLDEYDVVPALRPGGDRHESLRDGARIELGLRKFLERRRLQRLHRRPSRTSTAWRQLPGLGRPAPDARRLRVRRRRRLEDRGDGPGDEGHERRAPRRRVVHGGLHLPPRPGRRPGPRRAHARGLRDRSPPAGRGSRSTRCRSAARPTRSASCSTPTRARPSPRASRTWASASGWSRRVVDVVAPLEPLPRLPVARADVAAAPGPARPTPRPGSYAGGSHHTSLGYAVTTEHLADFAAMSGIEFVVIDETTRLDAFRDRLRWNDLYYLLSRGL